MKTFITFINIKQVSTPVHCPAIQCTVSTVQVRTALHLHQIAQTLNNLNAVTVKRNWKLVSSELKLHKNQLRIYTIKNSRKL